MLPKPSRAARKERERQEIVESANRWLLLRAAVFARADYRCELCGAPDRGLDAHHLEGGSGKRRRQENIGNVMAVCPECHTAYHSSPLRYIEAVTAWCKRHGYKLPDRKGYR